MALSANTVLEVRNGGSDTNGGGFVTGASGTDWSLQNSAQYSVTDGVTAGTTTITSATAAFGTDVVGNLIMVSGGTGSVTAVWKQITARASATSITVDSSAGLTAGTGVTLKIGGALASPGMASAIATVAGMKVFVKYNASPYVATSASTSIAAGCAAPSTGTIWCGYDSTRSLFNTDANMPIYQIGTSVSSATLFNASGNTAIVVNFTIDGNSQTTSKGVNLSSAASFVWRIFAKNFTGGAFVSGATYFCSATTCSAVSPFGNANGAFCEAFANTVTGFSGSAGASFSDCISYANTGASSDGFSLSASTAKLVGCVAYNNGRDGFRVATASTPQTLVNCVAESNAAFGYNCQAANSFMTLVTCSSFSNTSGRSNSSGLAVIDVGAITTSASAFTTPGSGIFTLNSTSGAGAVLRGLGFPALYPAGLTASSQDVGAVQHADPAGSTGGSYAFCG